MTLYILCGIPGSGKTTKSHELVTLHNAKLYCADELFRYTQPKDMKQALSETYSQMASELLAGNNVVYDDLNHRLDQRLNILSAVSDIECKKILLVMDTPIDECLIRNANREVRVTDFTIRRVHDRFQRPTLEEGWDEIVYVRR